MIYLSFTVVSIGATALGAALWSVFWAECLINATRRRNWDTAMLAVWSLCMAVGIVKLVAP